MIGRPFAPAMAAAALALALAVSGCAAGGGTRSDSKPRAGRAAKRAAAAFSNAAPFDSATILLWRFGETAGQRIASEGGSDVGGTAGLDTRPDLGRVGGARRFTRSVDSFVWAAYQPALEPGAELTVEAWVRVDAFGQYEDTPIACRWNPVTAEQSWVLAVGGQNIQPPFAALSSPGYHADLIPTGFQNQSAGRLMFALQPERAGLPRTYFSNERIELGRWTHVAASFDGKVVQLFLNGRLDSQYAVGDAIRPSEAPLLVGNLFDPRALTSFGGELRLGAEVDRNPYYAFEGTLDELRISSVARTEFPYVR